MYQACCGRHRSRVYHANPEIAVIEAMLLARVYAAKEGSVLDHSHGTRLRVPAGPRMVRGRRALANGAFSDASDQKLIDAMLVGNRAAWTEFHSRYDKLIEVAASKVLSKARAPSDAVADVKGNVYAELLANDMARLRRWDVEGGYKLSSWLYMIAGSQAMNYLRSRRRRGTEALSEEITEKYGSDPENLYLQRERFYRKMAKLSESDQEIVRLYFIQGLNANEVAEIMGMKPGSIYSRVSRLTPELYGN